MNQSGETYPDFWRPPPFIKNPVRRWLLVLGIIVYLLLAIGSLEVNWTRVYEGLDRVTFREPVSTTLFVLVHAAHEIVRDTDIEGAVFSTGEDVNVVCHRWRFAPAKLLGSSGLRAHRLPAPPTVIRGLDPRTQERRLIPPAHLV